MNEWREGAPTESGDYWVIEPDGHVELHRDGYLHLPCWGHITYHMPARIPQPPRKKPEPGWYVVRLRDGYNVMIREVFEQWDRVHAENGREEGHWTDYEFGPKLPEGWRP